MKHTQTPLHTNADGDIMTADGYRIGSMDGALAALRAEEIVRCVNSHDALVENLKMLHDGMQDADEHYRGSEEFFRVRQALEAAGEKV